MTPDELLDTWQRELEEDMSDELAPIGLCSTRLEEVRTLRKQWAINPPTAIAFDRELKDYSDYVLARNVRRLHERVEKLEREVESLKRGFDL